MVIKMFSYSWISVLLALHLLCCHTQQTKVDWGYVDDDPETLGPSYWSEQFGSCSGERQSPVAFWRDDAEVDTSLVATPLSFDGYDEPMKAHEFVLYNNGHTFQVDIPDNVPHILTISGGGLPATYTLKQFHFHWSEERHMGSEHVFGHDARPLEIHFVHTKDNMGLQEAFTHEDGVAVIGVTFTYTPAEPHRNQELDKIVTHLDEVRFSAQRKEIEDSILLSELLPPVKQRQEFYRYNGSLTTPPCTESVVWTVFEYANSISHRQLDTFRALYSNTEHEYVTSEIKTNYRPPQSLNGRKILVPHEGLLGKLDSRNAGNVIVSSLAIIVSFCIICVF